VTELDQHQLAEIIEETLKNSRQALFRMAQTFRCTCSSERNDLLGRVLTTGSGQYVLYLVGSRHPEGRVPAAACMVEQLTSPWIWLPRCNGCGMTWLFVTHNDNGRPSIATTRRDQYVRTTLME